MALDIAVLGGHGGWRSHASISIEVHDEVVQAAAGRGCAQLLRMRDYWGEVVEFDTCALRELAEELASLLPSLSQAARLEVEEVRAVVSEAIATGQMVHALPD